VARQYCGQLGKQDNCQIAVSLSVANDRSSLPIAYRLYLPESWATDPDRRAAADVPSDVVFRTKPEIALDQIQAALAAGVPSGVVLGDVGYGIDTALCNDNYGGGWATIRMTGAGEAQWGALGAVWEWQPCRGRFAFGSFRR
jgi:hypothetical protein